MYLKSGDAVQVLDSGFVRYIDHMGSDTRVVEAARISYRSPSKGAEADAKLIHYLYKNAHTSPFEQCRITFNIKMPIFVMRQFVRHRMQSLNEVSARYTELPDEFYKPRSLRRQDNKNKQGSLEEGQITDGQVLGRLYTAYKFAYNTYKKLLEDGVAREQARMVLPVGIYTEIYTTWDLNNLFKFFRLREDNHAQAEHREFAMAMMDFTRACFPVCMDAYDYMKNKPYRQAEAITTAASAKRATGSFEFPTQEELIDILKEA